MLHFSYFPLSGKGQNKKYNDFVPKTIIEITSMIIKFPLKVNKCGIEHFSSFLFWPGEDCFSITCLK